MDERVHILADSTADFFSESMRRDAMSGMSIVLALKNERCNRSLKGLLGVGKLENVQPRKSRDCLLKMCTR